MIKKGIIATSMLIMVSGCASTSYHGSESEKVNFDSKAFNMLAEASIEARDELRLLAKTRDAQALGEMSEEQRKQRFQQATRVPEGFDKNTTIKFTGELIDSVKLISKLAGYNKVLEMGNKPRSPIIVNITQEDTSIINALREVSMQSSDSASIEVYPNVKQIRVVYNDLDQKSSSVHSQ